MKRLEDENGKLAAEKAHKILTDSKEMLQLVRSSILPFFATDITLRFSGIPDDRVAIAIKDDAATVSYYVVCLRSRAEYFKGIL